MSLNVEYLFIRNQDEAAVRVNEFFLREVGPQGFVRKLETLQVEGSGG